MLLILGGKSAGKKEYVYSLGYAESDFSCDIRSDKPVICELERTVCENPGSVDDIYSRIKNKEVIICCEVGCGVVPVSKQERDYREDVGRLCCMLAKNAECVVRVVAGIPQVIKGDAPCR